MSFVYLGKGEIPVYSIFTHDINWLYVTSVIF